LLIACFDFIFSYKTVEELTVSDVESVQMADYSLGMDQGVKLASGDHRWCLEVTLRDDRVLRMRFYSKQNRDDWLRLLSPYVSFLQHLT